MKLYRKMIRFYVCDYGGQGFAASIHYTSDWLYEDDPEVERLVKENEQKPQRKLEERLLLMTTRY